jgi:hypothetical protein
MDTFTRPGGIFDDNPFFDFRIPYDGDIPPPGYTLFQDSITHLHLGPTPIMYPQGYPFYGW